VILVVKDLINQPSLRNISMSYDRFIDDRLLTSRDVLNKKQIKMKLIDYDESARDFLRDLVAGFWSERSC
jgi:hypothetical protein